MIGTTISHYKILEKLGEGGMGVVYKAHDTKLNRTVALKFLKPQSLGSSQDKTRFLNEAQAAASLDHPNICTIHAIEEAEGQTFIVMAFLEGESLKEKIQRGPLKVEEVLDMSIQIADGLHQAHQKGIIHRDVKSGNIMLSVLGLVKIMDFGLARLSGRTSITETGTTLGTPSYMSPEQARGEKVDHRTDIWSLGVVMYEMITGRLPFRGDYQEAVVYSILNEQPEPPTSVRTGVPMELEKIVSKAMAKKADERYQHLDELLVDLRREKKYSEQRETSQKTSVRGKEYRKLSAIMFSDIVSYSRIMQQDEDLAMDLLARHNQLVRDAIKKYNGTEIKVIGDAFLVDFETVVNAVRCAIEVQETISRYNEDQPENRRILLRIGIHVGDIIIKENDVFGDGVNIASRIESLAEPGGICISQEVYNLVKHKLDVQVISLGPKELKNIKDKIEIYEILVGSIAGKELATAGRQIVARGKPYYKRGSTWIAIGVVLIGVVLGFYLFKFKNPEPSSQLASRILKAVNYSVEDPNISPDGNWIVYVAATQEYVDNIYIQSITGGTPKRITNDTGMGLKEVPCFSPDASEILYSQDDGIRDTTSTSSISFFNIYKVSVLGGLSKKIITNGYMPMWSPDGKTIAFEISGKDSESVWTANVDGSSQRQVASQAEYPMWLPDSKSLAYKRDIPNETKEVVKEIFVQELSSGKEQQITFQKKNIASYCWAPTDEIIFNFIQGTYANFWVVPAKGGIAKQLTSDLTINRVPRLSKDAKRLVYENQSTSSNLWSADSITKDLRQLTFEDATIYQPIYSPKGNKILYTKRTFDYYELFVSNADGNEATQICSLKMSKWGEHYDSYILSVDEKAVAYGIIQLDSVLTKGSTIRWYRNIFVQDLEKNTTRYIGKGFLIDWSLDRKYMLIQPEEGNPQCIIALTDSLDKPILPLNNKSWKGGPSFTHDSKSVLYADSTQLWSIAIASGQRTMICELPKGTWWVREMPDGKSIGIGTEPPGGQGDWTAYKFLRQEKKLEKLFEVIGDFYEPSYSPDMKTFIVSKRETRNKIVVIDNFR